MARIAFELPAHPFGWPLDSIQRQLGISERTLKRYIAAARGSLVDNLGNPYFQVVAAGGKLKLRLPPARKPVESTAFQAVSLYFTLTILKFLEGTVLKEGVEDVWENFLAALRPIDRGDLGELDRKFYAIPYTPKNYSGLGHLLNPIVQGLIRQYRLRVEYATGRVHEMDPYTLIAYRGGLYLVGKTQVHRHITTLAVERIRSAQLCVGEDGAFHRFVYPAGFRPERYTEGAFGIIIDEKPVAVEILIHNKETENYLRARTIHPSQKFTARRDGKSVLAMTVRGTTELRNWIMGFGPWLEVLKPAELRSELSDLMKKASRNYRGCQS